MDLQPQRSDKSVTSVFPKYTAPVENRYKEKSFKGRESRLFCPVLILAGVRNKTISSSVSDIQMSYVRMFSRN